MSSSRSGSGDESNNVDGRVAAVEALTALAAQPQQVELATMMEAIRGEALRAQATLLEQLESKETQLASVTEALKDAKLSNANLRDLFLQISGDYSKKLADAETKYDQKAAKAASAYVTTVVGQARTRVLLDAGKGKRRQGCDLRQCQGSLQIGGGQHCADTVGPTLLKIFCYVGIH
jgi:hypothetical protein